MAKAVDGIINETKRRAVVERMWLTHYNNTLLQRGFITPDQHRKMAIYIRTRKPSWER